MLTRGKLLHKSRSPPKPEQKNTRWVLTNDVTQEVTLSDSGLEELHASELPTILTRWTILHPGHQRVGEILAVPLFEPNDVSPNSAGEVDPPRHTGSGRTDSKKLRSSFWSAQ